MRALIAKEKGDQDPWDLKLASGGLTDLDFLAQALVLAHASDHRSLVGQASRGVIAEAGRLGLLPEAEAQRLVGAHALFTAVFQWQRLVIAGAFDASSVPPAILQRLAAVAGLPDAKILLDHLNGSRGEVREIFSRALDSMANLSRRERSSPRSGPGEGSRSKQ